MVRRSCLLRSQALPIPLLTLVCLATPPAAAQTAAVSSRSYPGEVVVTARKQPEPLARVAAPVSVISGNEILESEINHTHDLDDRFVALTVQPTATGNLIFIRGVGNFTLLPNSDPAAGFVYDGVFISRPMGTVAHFYDLNRIELLKGPQGVLYGRNASAGSINLQPRQPVIDERSAYATLSTSDPTGVHGEAAANLAIGRSAALRLSGAMARQDALLGGYETGPDERSGRAQVKAQIAPGVSTLIAADYNRISGIGAGTSYVGNYVFDRDAGAYRFVESGIPLSLGIYSPEGQAFRQTIFLPSAGRNLDAISSSPRQDHTLYGVHGRIEADLGFGALTLIPAWRKSSIDAIVSGSPFGYVQAEQHDQASLEARLAGRTGRLGWIAGAFLFRDAIDADTTTNLSSALISSQQLFRTFSKAAFADVTLNLASSVRVNAGARWTKDRKRYRSQSSTLSIICQRQVQGRPACPAVPLFPLVEDAAEVPFPIPAAPGQSLPILVDNVPTGALVFRSALSAKEQLTDRALTWRAGGDVDVGPRSLLYGAVETGYRPGGFNTAAGFETYEPERITAFTLGLRHRTADSRLGIALEAFWWNYKDQQVSSLRPDLSTPPRNANITENIGSSRIRGIEADVRLQPWRDGQVGAVIQYLDAGYRSFEYVYANVGVPPLTGCATRLDSASNLYTVDCSAKQPYNSPRWSLNLDLRHRFTLAGLPVTAIVDTQFRSARNIGFAFLPEQRIGGTWRSNAQLVLGIPKTRVDIAAFVRNIEGDRTPEFMIYHPMSNALVAGTNAGRQFGVRALLRL